MGEGMSDSGNRMRRRLPSHPSSAGEARRMVRRLLREAGRDDLLEPAQLLVSEVVTNALVHSGTAIDVSMAADDDGVLVEVGDGSKHVPRLRAYAPTASTGRGLALLDQTADAWGVVPGVRGKTVWFQLSSADEPATSAPAPPFAEPDRGAGGQTATPPQPAPSPRDDTVTVELLNVPLLLHTAWQQHAEAVLREYLLASMDPSSDTDPLAVHAMATDALAVLAEHIPGPAVGIEPDEVMDNAVGPNVSSPRVELKVPRSSVPHFRVLDAALDAAQQMCERGELLVPVVQPELRAMRRWMCEQVLDQAAGAAPASWPPREVLKPPSRGELDWESELVTDSALAMVAADDTDVIVAVSPSAVRLLGYATSQHLVGRRLIEIIPRRLRQAHLAGFTLHLLTGRGPLLSRPVKVPALRRDGSETTVDLTIEAHNAPSGRCVFVATMRPADGHPT
jgi:PAS domain S-box-containing protein